MFSKVIDGQERDEWVCYLKSERCPGLCLGEHWELSWVAASEMGLPQLLLLVPENVGVYISLVVAFLLIWELNREGLFVLLLPSKFLPPTCRTYQETSQENLELSFSAHHLSLPVKRKRGGSGSKVHTSWLDLPSALYLSALNIKEVHQGDSHRYLHKSVLTFSGHCLISSFMCVSTLESALEEIKKKLK